MTEINHEYTDDIVCPHCGYAQGDSWEISGNEDGKCGEVECAKCNKTFYYECYVSVTYTTEKKP